MHSRSGFQHAVWLIQVLFDIDVFLVKWTAIHIIMKKTNNPASVTISTATAEAICKLLYSENGGVDMSPIIDDLGGDIKTKLNVGLVMKNLKPEVDETPRMYSRLSPRYRYRFVRYEMLTDRVFYSRDYRCDDGSWSEDNSRPETMSLDEWENRDIWVDPDLEEAKAE